MLCPKCTTELPDAAVCCWKCGKKLVRKKRNKGHRPRGTGTVVELGGRRVNRFLALMPAKYTSGKEERQSLGYFASYEEASAALDLALHAKNPQAHVMTMKDLYEAFCATPYYQKLSDSGKGSHASAWTWLSSLSNQSVSEVKTSHFQTIIDAMAEKGRTKGTIDKVRNLASLLCKHAMKDDLMDKNYGRLTDPNGKEAKEATPFSDLQLKILWGNTDRQAVMAILLMCYTGMRPGELFSVNVDNVHLGRFQYIRAGIKTDAGRGKDGEGRIIPIPADILPIVKRLIADRESGALVTTPSGLFWDPANWRKRQFYPLLAELGFQSLPDKDHPAKLTPNCGRHTFYTNMRRGGADPLILAEIMGHEDVETGTDNYNHYTDDDIQRICSQAVLFPSISNSVEDDPCMKKITFR